MTPTRLAMSLVATTVLCSIAAATPPDAVDVTSFGAKGDGQTDDTAAIQQAADAVTAKTNAFKPDGGVYLGAGPPLYFPAGHYRISDEITLGGYTTVRASGKAVVEQTGDCRVFVFDGGYANVVSGLRFLGGTNQIYFSNANTDTTSLVIEKCEFHLASDFAIYTHGTTDGHLSAVLTVADSKFIYPRQVLRNVCDAATVRDCWVSVGKRNFAPDSAVFVNRSGTLMFDNMFGVPLFGDRVGTSGRESVDQGARWVDNYRDLIVRRSRFGGECAGIPIVHHFGNPRKDYPWWGQAISIENSAICAGPSSSAKSGVVTLRTGVPQVIRLVGNRFLADTPMIRTDGVDLDTYFDQLDIPHPRDRMKISIRANVIQPPEPVIPEPLREFLQ